jgi:hypothetical protein
MAGITEGMVGPMRNKLGFRFVRTTVLSLFLGLLVPIASTSVVSAGTTITKEVYVKDRYGAPLVGAIVRFGYGTNIFVASTPIATIPAGSDHVSITLPSDYLTTYKLGIWVEPPAGDTQDAMGMARSVNFKTFNGSTSGVYLDPTASGRIDIQLKPSTIIFNPTLKGGAPLPLSAMINAPVRPDGGSSAGQVIVSTYRILRSGAVGFNIDSSITQTELSALNGVTNNYAFSVFDPTGSLFGATNYTATLGSPATLTQYDDSTNPPSLVSPQPTPVGGVYTTNNQGSNFFVTTKDPRNNQPLATGSDNGSVTYFVENSAGEQQDWVASAPIDDQGLSGTYLPDGTYFAIVSGPNSVPAGQVPTFGTSTYTVTVSGSTFTMIKGAVGGGGATVTRDSNGIFQTSYTVANIVGQVFSAPNTPLTFGNNQQLCSHLQAMDNTGNFQDLWETESCSSSPSYGLTITSAGTYRVEIRPYGFSGYTNTQSQNIVVTGTAGNLTLASAGSDSGSKLTKNITLDVPNLHLKVINPNDSNNPLRSGWVNINTLVGDQENGYFNAGIDPNYGSVVDAKLPDGTYVLQVNSTITGLAQQKYTIVVASGNITMYLGMGTSGARITPDNSQVYTVRPAAANVSGVFLVNGAPAPNTPSSNVSICDQYLVNGNWQWNSCTGSSNTTGAFSFTVSTNGTHRISFQPNGVPGIATTYSPQFVVASNGAAITYSGTTAASLNLGTITAVQPTLSVKITAGGVAQRNAGVEIRLNNQFIEWDNTGSDGTTGISLSQAGTYEFIVRPASSGLYSSKTYKVVATGSAGNLTITIDGVTPTNNTFVLPLAASSIGGTVKLPDGSIVRNTQVVATDATGQDLWQYSANVNYTGTWSMTLPAGTYSVRAMSPNGLTQYSDSKSLGTITINSSGNATLSGEIQTGDNANATPFQITLKLQLPYWSGTVRAPSVGGVQGAVQADAQVCLFAPGQGRCSNTDSQGNWSMSKPNGFDDFNANYSLQVRPSNSSTFAAAIFSGKTAINGAGFLTAGAAGIGLVLAQPNFILTITAPDGTAASNLWVNVSPVNGGQMLSNGGTDSNGRVSLSIPQANFATGLRVNVDVQNNAEISAKYGQTSQDYSAANLAAGLSNGVYSVSLALVAPNIRGQLTYVGGAVAGNTNVDLFNASNQNWITNGYVGQTGSFTLNAPKTGSAISYTLTVRPPYNSATPAAPHSYTVNVKADGTIDSITDPNTTNNAALTASGGIYTFSLVSPSVIGVVKSSDDKSIPNSWVSPNMPGQEGSNSDANGKFALALPNGTWPLQANVPWGDSKYAPSALCTVTVALGATTGVSGSGCSFDSSSKVITLRLQDPNLSVTLKDATGTVIPNGYVSVDVGNWHSGSQTDSSGVSRIFVDWNAIKTSNAIQNGPIGIHVGLHPAWGTSTSITLDCDSYNQNNNAACPDLTALNGNFPTTAWTVTLPAPNTRLSVVETTTATTGQQNAWATLFTYAPAANGNEGYINGYIGGSNTDSSGVAVFNVLDTNLRYAVQVNPSWNDTTHAQQTLTNGGLGYTYAQVNNQKFALGSPNLTLTSLDKTGNSVNRGGWVCAEYFNDTLGYSRQWISCVGFNQLGVTKMLLPDTVSSNADKKYVRITFNSGDSSFGATTSCTVTVNNGVVTTSGLASTCTLSGSSITQRLSSGNVQGLVKRADNSVVVGAIVKATVHGLTGDNQEASAVMTSTGTDGLFGLQLDSSKLWDIKIIPVHVNDSPDLASLNVQANSGAATGTGIQPPGGQLTLNLGGLTLSPKL